MQYLLSDVKSAWPHVKSAIDARGIIHVRAYGVLPVTEEFLRKVILAILEQAGRTDLQATATMLLKELTINATKANFKRIVFQENRIDATDAKQYQRGLNILKEALSEEMPYIYAPKAKRENLHVIIALTFDDKSLRIEVVNNTPMKKEEEARVREKLALAMSCEDVGDFIQNHGDDTEGAGLGIFLSLAALRAAGVDPRVCVIKTDGKKMTTASFELPLRPDYKPAVARY